MFISKGNNKLLGIPNLSLPTMISCKNNLKCKKYCYSNGLFRLNHEKYLLNFNKTKDKDFKYKMISSLSSLKTKVFRVHTIGDFYSVDYILDTYYYISKLPNISFYAYTKRDDLFTKDIYNKKPSTFNIIYSIDSLFNWVKKPSNKDLIDLTKEFYYFDTFSFVTTNYTNCESSLNNSLCFFECKKCFNKKNKYIFFKKH